jgi:hypothetical protein
MRYQSALLLFACATVAFSASQEAPQLNARELFYAAVQSAVPASHRPVAPAKVDRLSKPPATGAESNLEASRNPAADSVASSGPALGAHVIPAAAIPSASPGPALGLKYTILKKSGDDMVEVSSDSIFHAGDRIRISVEANQPGYLYIITQGSSGAWKPLFPSPELADGDNYVTGYHDYLLPPKSRMVFDDKKGAEKLFLVFSREPEPNLEKVIYSLTGGEASPANAPRAEHAKTLLVLNSGIDDATVGQLRAAHSRDLIIEKVDEQTSGEKKETAVYVVNPAGSNASRVVADLVLIHQ